MGISNSESARCGFQVLYGIYIYNRQASFYQNTGFYGSVYKIQPPIVFWAAHPEGTMSCKTQGVIYVCPYLHTRVRAFVRPPSQEVSEGLRYLRGLMGAFQRVFLCFFLPCIPVGSRAVAKYIVYFYCNQESKCMARFYSNQQSLLFFGQHN